MHFEIFIEDKSGKAALENIIPRLLEDSHTYKVIAFQGLGNIPKNINKVPDPKRKTLLDKLPGILRAYGRSSQSFKQLVLVICDLDDKCLKDFRNELLNILTSCNPKPETQFCIAVEESEAWLMGDIDAIKKAYPKARSNILNNYINDSICGTWETLADAVYKGGSQALKKKGYMEVGIEKSNWARNITPYMNFEKNKSPSFAYFIKKVQQYFDTGS